uniref:Uncharacterized protein n=1 Tax=Glossina pallidipes TaxID=7398 RepID=A0A1B0A3C0_GLOPL
MKTILDKKFENQVSYTSISAVHRRCSSKNKSTFRWIYPMSYLHKRMQELLRFDILKLQPTKKSYLQPKEDIDLLKKKINRIRKCEDRSTWLSSQLSAQFTNGSECSSFNETYLSLPTRSLCFILLVDVTYMTLAWLLVVNSNVHAMNLNFDVVLVMHYSPTAWLFFRPPRLQKFELSVKN